ncbi:DoxX family protein, partial [Streptomyces sp. NPDC059233]
MVQEQWGRTMFATVPAPGTTATHDVGLLVLRIVVGLAMVGHGTQKLFGWFGGPGLSATGKGFTQAGYPAGDAMAVIAGLSETLGGLGRAPRRRTPRARGARRGGVVHQPH